MCADAGRVCAALAQDVLWEVGLEGVAAGKQQQHGRQGGRGIQSPRPASSTGGSLLARALNPGQLEVAVTARLVPGAHSGFTGPQVGEGSTPGSGSSNRIGPPVASPQKRRGRQVARVVAQMAEQSLGAAHALEKDAALVCGWTGAPGDGGAQAVSRAAEEVLEAGGAVLWRGPLWAAEELAEQIRELYESLSSPSAGGFSSGTQGGWGLPVARTLSLPESAYTPEGESVNDGGQGGQGQQGGS